MSKRVQVKEVLLIVALLLYISAELFEKTSFFALNQTGMLPTVTKACRYGAYFLCIVKLVINKTNIHRLENIMLIGFLVFLSCIFANKRTMILGFLFIIAAEEIRDSIVLKTTVLLQGIALFITIFLSQVGIWVDYIFDTERMRHGLGFSWTTTGPILYFYFMLEICYLYKKKIKIWHLLLLEAINFYFYIMTDTRMAFILSSAFLVLFALNLVGLAEWKKMKYFNWLFIITPVICCFISFALAFLYNPDNEKWVTINTLLSGRLRLERTAIETYGISLLGQPVEWVGWSINKPPGSGSVGYNYVDCSYIQLAIGYGVIFLIVSLLIYIFLIYKNCETRDYYAVLVLITIVVLAITEPRLMNFSFNIFPVLLFCKQTAMNKMCVLESKKYIE